MKRQLSLIFLIHCFILFKCDATSGGKEMIIEPKCTFNGGLVCYSDYLGADKLPNEFLPFEEFEKQFQLSATSTEQLNRMTKTLSQTMHENISKGLKQLLLVDEKVVKGLENFIPSIELFAPILSDKVKKGGRIFLVGSGSSGRVAIDIAAKCNQKFPAVKKQIQGIIAGGDSAFIRAREGFEDSESDGMKALQSYHLGSNDTVILISASGSASFNVGCGHFAADKGAYVLYFYNSESIPSRTQNLFNRKENPVIPLCVDIGPQAIAGSTRLQAASLAEANLGGLLASTLYLHNGEKELAYQYPLDLAVKLKKGIFLIQEQINSIAQFVSQEQEVFSDPCSNFRQLKDQTDQGYVTFIATEDSIREVLIDSTETSPTFSTNPIRREYESHKKRAEFQAYLVGRKNNQEAWEALLGRSVCQGDLEEVKNFLLSSQIEGLNSYQKRPIGKGNFLIAVAKLNESGFLQNDLVQSIKKAGQQGGKVGFLLICNEKLKEPVGGLNITPDALAIIENVPDDSMGIVGTIVLKQVLNLISNGSMVLMNKVHGNQMIDVRASNNKLIDRCMRLIKEIWNEYRQENIVSNQQLYHCIAHIIAQKKHYEEKGVYTPSVVKIALAMFALNKSHKDFQEVVEFLNHKQERIDWIGNPL